MLISLIDCNHYLSKHPNTHLLQTGEWGELKSAFGWEPVRIVSGNSGVQILFRKLPLGFTVGYIPKANFEKSLWSEIDTVCKQHRAIFVKLEPDSWENLTPETWNARPERSRRVELRTSPHNIQPPRTIIVDIRGTEEDILARMKQKTRYNIRLAEKKGVTVRTWDDIDSFHTMMLVTGGRDGFGVHSFEYYKRAYELFHPKQMCEILVAEYEGKPLAAFFLHDLYRDGFEAMYWAIIQEYQAGASRMDTIAKLIGIGYSLEQAREQVNLREGENGNDNGC